MHRRPTNHSAVTCLLSVIAWLVIPIQVDARAEMLAGVAKVDITDRQAGPVHDPLFAKALVLQQAETRLVIVTVDAVAIGEIGRIGNDYLAKVRAEIEKSLGIPPRCVLVGASHCHGGQFLGRTRL